MIKKFLAETKTGDPSKYSESTKYLEATLLGSLLMALIGFLEMEIGDIVQWFTLTKLQEVVYGLIACAIIIPVVVAVFYKFILKKSIQEYTGNKQ